MALIKKIYQKFLLRLDRRSKNPQMYSTLNEDCERKLLYDVIKDSKFYLEFGSGGSTFDALKLIKNGKICSIESSLDWFNYMQRWDFIKKNIKNNKLDYCYFNIGKTGDWGTPIEDNKKAIFPNYYSILATEYAKNVDTILIDGRFRVACALNAILYLKPSVKILIHDFSNREYYQIILKYCNVLRTAGTLYELSIKENLDKNELIADIDNYKFDFR